MKRFILLSALALPILLTVGCLDAPEESCERMCDELVRNCSYLAFPGYSSCYQGCMYEAEQLVAVHALTECVIDAECDTFTIIQCDAWYGLEE